jgi:hypothetical protein
MICAASEDFVRAGGAATTGGAVCGNAQLRAKKSHPQRTLYYSVFFRASSNMRWARDGLNTPQEQNLAM